MIWLLLKVRFSSYASLHRPTPRLSWIRLPLTEPPLDQVVLIPPDSQSAIQKPSVLLSLTSLALIRRLIGPYCPTPRCPLGWIRFFSRTAPSAFTSIAPTAWFQRMLLAYTFQPGPSTSTPACGGV